MQQLCEFCKEPRSMSEILVFFQKTDRTKFRKQYIYPLIEKNFLELTIPDKPQSSNQRYITTKIGQRWGQK